MSTDFYPHDNFCETRMIFRMDTTELLARIKQRRKVVKLSERAACLKAGPPVTVDSIRLIRRGHPPRRQVLRALAAVLECDLAHLEEVAPDIRLNSRNGGRERDELLRLYDEASEAGQKLIVDIARGVAALPPTPPNTSSIPAKRGR
jgi:hypothetical protein